MYPECELYFLESKGYLWKQIMNVDKTSRLFRMKFLTGNMGEKKIIIAGYRSKSRSCEDK